LAWQKTLEGRRAMKSVYLKYGLVIALIMGIGVLLYVGLSFYSYFDESQQSSIPENQRKLKDNRKYQYFMKLGIDKHPNYALKYLSTGIAEHCDLFLDLSLIKFIADFHPNAQVYSLLTQMLCCFPSNSRLLNSFFSQTLSFSHLGISQRFLLYQVYQVNCLRQSSLSPEITL
jgi:hypothetical protein